MSMCESDQMYLRRRGVCVLFFSPVSHLQSLGEQLCESLRASVAATLLDLATTTSSSPTVEGVTTCEHMPSPN